MITTHHMLRVLALSVVVASVSIAGFPEQGSAQTAEEVGQRIEHARSTLTDMKSRYGVKEDDARYQLEIRLQEGLVLLDLGDPERASVLFLDIVERDDWKGQPGYKHAQFLLGQSLYESSLHNSARVHLQEVARNGRPEDYQPAVTLLIEIAIQTDDWTDINELYAEIDRTQGGRAIPELNYARGKALYAEERYEEAVNVFSRVDMSTVTGLKSRYYSGVTRIKLDRLDEAMSDFVAVTEGAAAIDGPEAREVKELAYMARSRIHYEREEWTEALDMYQYVPRSSPHFDQALYEITWTQVRREEPRMALRFIQILELLHPDSIFIPEARRLKGDLYKDVNEYEDALATYEELLFEFEPILSELDGMVEGQADPLGYFKDLVGEDTVGRAQYLPRDAARWVQPDGQMQDAAGMVGSLVSARESMEESRILIAEIEAAIDGDNRYEFFKESRGAWSAANAFEASMLSIQRDINDLESEMLGGAGGDARQERLQEQSRYDELPQTREDFVEREQSYQIAVEERQLKAHRLRISIEGSEAQVDAIERWLLVEGSRTGLSEAEEGSIRDSLRTANTEIDRLKGELKDIDRELRVMNSLGSGDSSLLAKESEVRQSYRMALNREADALKSARGAGGGDVARLDKYRTDIKALQSELDNFRAQIVALVDTRVDRIRQRLDVERNLLGEYDVRYDQRKTEVQNVAGEIAYNHYKRVRKLFADLVLSADVGVVDVAWLKKEAKSRELDYQIESRNQEREVLEQEFKQVLRELGQEEESGQ